MPTNSILRVRRLFAAASRGSRCYGIGAGCGGQRPPPMGPRIEPPQLVGLYADPHGGTVTLQLEGADAFRLTHSLHGPIPTSGVINERYIELLGMRATFTGAELVWDNGVVARRVGPVCVGDGGRRGRCEHSRSRSGNSRSSDGEVSHDVRFHGPEAQVTPHAFDVAAALRNIHVVLGVSSMELLRCKQVVLSRWTPDFYAGVDQLLGRLLFSNSFGFVGFRKGSDVWSEQLAERLQPWSAIPRGSRLFIKGLGTFDIREAQKHFKQEKTAESRRLLSQLSEIQDAMESPSTSEDDEPLSDSEYDEIEEIQGGEEDEEAEHVSNPIQKMTSSFTSWLFYKFTPKFVIPRLPCPGNLPLHSLVPCPAELQAYGYAPFGRLGSDIDVHFLTEIFELADDDFRLRFFVKHHLWFFTCQDQYNRLDEVLRLPAELHNLLLVICEERNHGFGDILDLPVESAIVMLLHEQPRRVLDAALRIRERIRSKGPLIHIAWLERLPDKHLLSGRTLQPLRSSAEFEEIGRALRNCAGDLVGEVQRRECILVKLTGTEGLPVALGRFQKTHWVEISGKRNSEPSADVRAEFEEWRVELGHWWERDVSE